jgi:hypothetical protein
MLCCMRCGTYGCLSPYQSRLQQPVAVVYPHADLFRQESWWKCSPCCSCATTSSIGDLQWSFMRRFEGWCFCQGWGKGQRHGNMSGVHAEWLESADHHVYLEQGNWGVWRTPNLCMGCKCDRLRCGSNRTGIAIKKFTRRYEERFCSSLFF